MVSVIRRTRKDAARIAETDPTQMAYLRLVCRRWNDAALCTPELWRGLLINLDLWTKERIPGLSAFADNWYARAGTNSPLLRIAICECSKEEREHIGPEYGLLKQVLSILFGQQRNWSEWSFSSIRLLKVLRPSGGLRSACRPDMGSYTRVVDRLKHFSAEFPYSPTWPEGQYSWTPLSYGLSDPQDKEAVGWESTYLSIQRITPKAAIVPMSFPSRLRSLHIYGHFYISFSTIFEAPHLEELIFETSYRAFRSIDRQHAASHSLQRLIFIGNASVAAVWTDRIFEQLTLPNLKFIQHRKFKNYVSRQTDTNIIRRFFERSALTEIELSLEDSDLVSVHALKCVLVVFAEVKISKLFLDSPIPLLHLPNNEFRVLRNAVETVICRFGFMDVGPTKDSGRPNPGIKRARLILPSPSHLVPEVLAHRMKVHFVSRQDLGVLFDHHIQGHQYEHMHF